MATTKPIDFSCKHDYLIRRKDGRLVPMDEPCYDVKQIAENTWQIMSSGDYHYLVVGDEEGISIDTGYGAGNLREFLEELCGKPVRSVINTHSHFDHTANNTYFDKAYISAEDAPKAAIPYPSFEGIEFPRDYEEVIVDDGTIIPLKGRELEIFKIGDHTPGGIAILDRKARLIFTGDELMPGGKTVKSAEKFLNDMDKIYAHRAEYDRMCGGTDVFDASELIDPFWEAAHMIAEGKRSERPERQMKKWEPLPEVPGKVVYDCQFPHPEDGPGAKKGKGPGGPGGRPGGGPGGPGGRPGGPGGPGGNMGCLVHKGQVFMFPEKEDKN